MEASQKHKGEKKKYMSVLVSVIITTYGRTDFLNDAISSVIHQDYDNLEIIVVDDNAKNLIVRREVERIVQNYPQCILIKNTENLGGSLSRNEGIKKAKGAFISFLDDDDTYKPERIRKYMQAFEKIENHEEVGLIYGFVDAVDANGTKIGEYRIEPSSKPLYQHMCSCIAATSQWLIPKYVFDKVGMFEDTPCKQDSIMLLKILGAGYDLVCVKEFLGQYREHNHGRISGVSQKNVIGLTNFRNWSRKYYSQLTKKQQKNVECVFAEQLLTLSILLEERKQAREHMLILFKNNPFSMRTVKGITKYIIGKTYIKYIR